MLNPYAAKYAHIMDTPIVIEEPSKCRHFEEHVEIKETVDTALAEHFKISSQREPSK